MLSRASVVHSLFVDVGYKRKCTTVLLLCQPLAQSVIVSQALFEADYLFSGPSQTFHRFNSGNQDILVFGKEDDPDTLIIHQKRYWWRIKKSSLKPCYGSSEPHSLLQFATSIQIGHEQWNSILALTKERGQAMREHMQTRLEMLRKELTKGQVELQKVESQRTYLHETILRISGAIQLLEELLAEEQSAAQNGAASPDKAQLATTQMQ